MAKKTVLAIGIEPSFADFSAFPQLTAELVRQFIEAQLEKLRAGRHGGDRAALDQALSFSRPISAP